MLEIEDYKVVEVPEEDDEISRTLDYLRIEVLKLSKKGFTPIGGAKRVSNPYGEMYYTQTMVRYKKEEVKNKW